jgi:hypothetical protein
VSLKCDDAPSMNDLVAMGLRPQLIELAKSIGVESFFKLWRFVDDAPLGTAGEGGQLHIPRFTKWIRHNRNNLIVALRCDGHSLPEIKRQLRRKLDIDISTRTIRRVVEAHFRSERPAYRQSSREVFVPCLCDRHSRYPIGTVSTCRSRS